MASAGFWIPTISAVHKEAGHEHLDHVCRIFPRYPMSTSRGVELTLSFSCPAVLRLVSRAEPLTVIRSEEIAAPPDQGSYVITVHPRQKNAGDPLRYYFELEQHFIDIIQCRGLETKERLALINHSINEIIAGAAGDGFGQLLNDILYRNYEILDAHQPAAGQDGQFTPDILLEHFFANFIFKKPFYLFGLRQTGQILMHLWQYIVDVRKGLSGLEEIEQTRRLFSNWNINTVTTGNNFCSVRPAADIGRPFFILLGMKYLGESICTRRFNNLYAKTFYCIIILCKGRRRKGGLLVENVGS